jgi:hypothetical protein
MLGGVESVDFALGGGCTGVSAQDAENRIPLPAVFYWIDDKPRCPTMPRRFNTLEHI